MTYELEIEQFKGPLDKLLELIEARKLEITEISLAAVTDDFIRYLQTLADAEQAQTGAEKTNVSPRLSRAESRDEVREGLRLLADFIAIASRLILIKSKSLLPDVSLTGEEEAEIKDLEDRLKLYRALKPGMKHIAGLWQNGNREFGRPYFLDVLSWASAPGMEVFYPGPNLSVAGLTSPLQKILEGFEKISSEEATVREEIISIEEKIKEIVNRIQKFGESTLAGLSVSGSRAELIAVFLAVLHLAHEQLIFLEQKSHFSDIMVKTRPEFTNASE
ncbi:MAG: segregation/condensation protein A [Candidatus Liptonbacteria bacterium]|nr:segregation/condensation protein A [Candidatus Liptonbacteria bacterium]